MAPFELYDLLSIDTDDEQHDAVLDYYGRRLATCSSDKTIKIFEVEGESHRLVETLKGYVALRSTKNKSNDAVTDMKGPFGVWHG